MEEAPFRVGQKVRVHRPGYGWHDTLTSVSSVTPVPADRVEALGPWLIGFDAGNFGEIALPAECFRAIAPPPSKTAPPPSHRVHLTILGETASKANSRQLVVVAGRPRFVLSKKAKQWVENARGQIPIRNPLLAGPLVAWCRCWYASERPDLDPSLVWDVLQGRIYGNDRQLREMHIFHAIDRTNPRVEVVLEPIQGVLAA